MIIGDCTIQFDVYQKLSAGTICDLRA